MTAVDTGVPVIDAGALRSGSPAELADLARQLGNAARTIGFFSIVNHGVPAPDVAALFAESRRFFALPLATKLRASVALCENYNGYAEFGLEQNGEDHPGDAKESFDIGPPYEQNLWPEQLPGFRSTVSAAAETLSGLLLDLMRPLAIDLGMEPDFFATNHDRALWRLRLLRYPPHPGRFDGSLYGVAPHTDWGSVTLLAQDDVGGLDVRKRDGTWISVAPTPGAFVCNIGDSLMRWSNGAYVSTPHRVVNQSTRDRYSIAFFGSPNPDALIEALPSCVSADAPPAYPPIVYEDYLRERHAAVYPAAT